MSIFYNNSHMLNINKVITPIKPTFRSSRALLLEVPLVDGAELKFG